MIILLINDVGVMIERDAEDDYVDFLKSTVNIEKIPFKIAIDTSNGATSVTAKKLFSKFEVDFSLINCNPDGYNINLNCGSTHLESLKEYVLKNKCDLGIAYDGDGDRALFISEKGEEIDGDYILAICSKYMKLDSIVGTVMSNLGLIKYASLNNLNFVSTKVGDRFVLEEMLKNNYSLGGEQSGHIIFKDYLNTGDGELTSLKLLEIMTKENQKLGTLKNIMRKYPQVLVNLEVTGEVRDNFSNIEEIQTKIHEYENILGSNGRIVVRKSGTENLIRIMIEGEDIKEITDYANSLAQYIKEVLKTKSSS